MEKDLAEQKITNLFAIANQDSNPLMDNVWTLMNVKSQELVIQQPFARTLQDLSPAHVPKEVLETREHLDANQEENVSIIEIVQLHQHVEKEDVSILALVSVDQELHVKLLLTKPFAHVLPELKETPDKNVDNWNVLKTQNVLWVDLVFQTNVLMLAALPESVELMPFVQF